MMNTTTAHFPIFHKDSVVLRKQMLGALGVQLALMIGIPLVELTIAQATGQNYQPAPYDKWFPMLQIGITSLFALVCAAHWWAEERAGGHDLLLRRLPIKSSRIWIEKTLAGFAYVLLAIALQFAWFVVCYISGIKIWDEGENVPFFLIVFGLYAYAVGLPLSCFFKQSIAVIMLGMVITYTTLIVGLPILRELSKLPPDAYSFLLLLCIIVVLLAACGAFFYSTSVAMQKDGKRFFVIWGKQAREYWLYNIAAFVLLGILIYQLLESIAVPAVHNQPAQSGMALLILIAAGTLSGALGVSTYTQPEKDGQSSVFYHHPIPIGHLYWSKFFYGLIVAVIPAIAIMVEMVYLSGREMSGEIENLGASVFLLYFAFGFIPYCCGVVMTHAIPNTIYAILETVPAVIMVFLLYMFIQFSASDVYQSMYGNRGVGFPDLLTTIPWTALLILAGLAIAGRFASCDRNLLAGSVLQRQLHVWRLFFFVGAAVILLTHIGWKDLLYLTTSIDIGIG